MKGRIHGLRVVFRENLTLLEKHGLFAPPPSILFELNNSEGQPDSTRLRLMLSYLDYKRRLTLPLFQIGLRHVILYFILL